MLILSIDTSTMVGSVALTRNEEVVAEYSLMVRRTHAQRLLPAIERLLADSGTAVAYLDALAVTLGPGSFTGLRIGLAVVKGLCYAAGKPVVGVPTLQALAMNLPFAPYPLCPMLDAKKKEVYCGVYRAMGDGTVRMEWEDRAIRPEELARHVREKTIFLGEGSRIYASLLSRELKDRALFAPFNFHQVRASNVGRLALRRLSKGESDDLFTLVPRYLRRSEAEIKWGERQKLFG